MFQERAKISSAMINHREKEGLETMGLTNLNLNSNHIEEISINS